jgi:carbamoyltransferase
MIIAGINVSHNASVALLKDGELLFSLEGERLSNIKYDFYPFQAISKIKDYVDHVDVVVLTGLTISSDYDVGVRDTDAFSAHILGLNKTFSQNTFVKYDLGSMHHEMHASTAFYNSGFKEALCIVKDGMGSFLPEVIPGIFARENGSAFVMTYPNNIEVVEKHLMTPYSLPNPKHWISNNEYITNSFSEANAYEITAELCGFTYHDAGKVMGMSAYGKPDSGIPPMYDENDLINPNLFKFKNYDLTQTYCNIEIPKDFQILANFCFKLQTEVQTKVADFILKMLEKTGQKNLCLSGGFFLNCVSNYNLLKRLPKDVKIYVEPMSSDAGNALGAARYVHHMLTNDTTIRPQTNIYYGPKYSYTMDDLKGREVIKDVSAHQVASLLTEGNIVALYQGRSESGPRALGNRSILYDPRDPNGKDHVNNVKKREWFRPFAGTVLKEYAKEWFDLVSLDESKFMMFAVDVLPEKQPMIPAITHIDGTCRVQTLTREDNEHYYDLISEFYSLTGVPILFNTSFNLAGNTIVETLVDALLTLDNSEIDFLYLPELKVLIPNHK